MKTILIALLALGFSVTSTLAETRLAGQSSTNGQQSPQLKRKAPSGGQSKLVPKGGCCARVNNHCVTICGKAGGCTGSGDCKTNPN